MAYRPRIRRGFGAADAYGVSDLSTCKSGYALNDAGNWTFDANCPQPTSAAAVAVQAPTCTPYQDWAFSDNLLNELCDPRDPDCVCRNSQRANMRQFLQQQYGGCIPPGTTIHFTPTAKAEDADIGLGLELGADDYVTKPFSPWCDSWCEGGFPRNKPEEPEDHTAIKLDDLVIDSSRHEVPGLRDHSGPDCKRMRILQDLARRPGWVFTREQIISAVKGDDYPVTERSVDVQIAGLRKKLGTIGNRIETVRGGRVQIQGVMHAEETKTAMETSPVVSGHYPCVAPDSRLVCSECAH